MSSRIVPAVLCLLAVVPAALGQDPMSVAPGQLNLPLYVHDDANVVWNAGPVTSGVALPPGLVTDLSKLRVVDAAGKPIPAQFRALERYWTRPDKSVRWLLVDFPADVFESESATVYLRDDGQGAAPATSLKVDDAADAITVDTGILRFTVSKKAFNLFDAAWFDQNGDGRFGDDELYIAPSPDNGSVITAAAWKEQGIEAGTNYYSSSIPPRRVAVEESGPVRVTIVADGMHAPRGAAADAAKPFYDYRVRITAWAGSPIVKVGYSICNMRTAEEQYVWPMAEASLVTRLKTEGEIVAVFLTDNNQFVNPPYEMQGQGQNFAAEGKSSMLGARCSDAHVLMVQDSSGGDEWQKLKGNGHARRIFGGSAVPGVSYRGWKVWRGGEEVAGGDRSPGLVDFRHNSSDPAKERGIIVTVRDFWQNYPKGLEADKDVLAVKVFPKESKQAPFDLIPGTRKTHEIYFQFHGPRLFERHYDWVWRRVNRPLMARPPADWTGRIAGAWDLGLANVPCVPASMFDKSVMDGCRVGWGNYGWISAWNPGGQHWNEGTQFYGWLLRGDRRAFEEAEITSRWAGDLVPVNFETENMDRYWMLMRGWNRRESKVPLVAPPGWKDSRGWIGYPDSGHMGMVMWLEHYRLTGDGFARDAVQHEGEWGRAYAWGSTHDCKPPFRINWAYKRDPDADPTYMNFNRYQAWPLFNFVSGYSANGDPQWLAEARIICLGYRNAMRANPVGYICDTIDDAGSREVYGKDFPPATRDRCASKAYANFQLSLVVNALVKYYNEDPDEEVRDAILGSVDILVSRALLHDDKGKPIGWSYCWGDLWGPSGTRGEWNDDVLTAVGYGYQVSGRKDFLEPLKVAFEEVKPYYSKFDNHAWIPVVYPRADQEPPAAVNDLKVEAVGGGKVRVSFAAPAGDPVNYQLKYAVPQIVERVSDWPLPGEALPKNKAEYQALVAKALERQVSFYMALNAKGEPAPGKSGARESFEVTLPPGTYHFALKSLDAANNQSAMSNVARVEVR
ncbi:MAG: hypothetical protein BIFFINMI_02559 [Phycisphaerae bacterium]|nr:hypothetical protein [Phycisphaerae bacterium]